ncbi:MAG: collagen binding domain-containing protein [Candidatus Sericytochromatia bacterium]
MHSRLFAAAVVAALATAGCQGSPASTPNGVQTPAKGMGLIRGLVTTAGVIAPGGGNYVIFQAAGGAPVAGANVQVQGAAFAGEIITGTDGSFSVQVPGGSNYTVTASHPDGKGGILKHVTVVEVPLADEPPIVDVASLVTRRTGSIQGVVELSGGADPEGADVFVPGTTIVGKVSTKGRFALANVPEGTWNIVVQKPGFKRAALTDLTVQAGRPLVLTAPVALEAGEATGGQVKALIRDAQGRAIVGATVTATDSQGAGYTGVSDGQGNVTLPGVPDGTYHVQVYRSFYQVPPAQRITLTSGQGGDLGTISMNSTVLHFGKIAGRLLDEAGQPIDGAVVQLDPPVTEQVFTDAGGHFTLDRVMPGEYTLRAAAGGFEVGERDVLVDNKAGFTANLGGDFKLRPPFDPAKPKAADRPAATLLPPNARTSYEGDDLIIRWEPVALPPGISKIAYNLDGQAAPGAFVNLAATEAHQLTLKGFGKGHATFKLMARPADESEAAGYHIRQVTGTSTGQATTIVVGQADPVNPDLVMVSSYIQRAQGYIKSADKVLEQLDQLNDEIIMLRIGQNQLNYVWMYSAGNTIDKKHPSYQEIDKLFAKMTGPGSHPRFNMTAAEWKALVAKEDLLKRIQKNTAYLETRVQNLPAIVEKALFQYSLVTRSRDAIFAHMNTYIDEVQKHQKLILEGKQP